MCPYLKDIFILDFHYGNKLSISVSRFLETIKTFRDKKGKNKKAAGLLKFWQDKQIALCGEQTETTEAKK